MRVLQMGREVAVTMENPPDFDGVRSFEVEDDVRTGAQRPGAEPGKPQLLCVPRRPHARLTRKLVERMFKRVDETRSQVEAGIEEVAVDDSFDVLVGERAPDDRPARLRAHALR